MDERAGHREPGPADTSGDAEPPALAPAPAPPAADAQLPRASGGGAGAVAASVVMGTEPAPAPIVPDVQHPAAAASIRLAQDRDNDARAMETGAAPPPEPTSWPSMVAQAPAVDAAAAISEPFPGDASDTPLGHSPTALDQPAAPDPEAADPQGEAPPGAPAPAAWAPEAPVPDAMVPDATAGHPATEPAPGAPFATPLTPTVDREVPVPDPVTPDAPVPEAPPGPGVVEAAAETARPAGPPEEVPVLDAVPAFRPEPTRPQAVPHPVPPAIPTIEPVRLRAPAEPVPPAIPAPDLPPPAPPALPDAAAPPAPAAGNLRRYLRLALWCAAGLVAGYAALLLVLVALYRFVDPPASTLMLGQRLTGTAIRHRWAPLERISPNLRHAVIVSEDGSFCRHRGIDWGELAEAIDNARDGIARGGSTITMQVVKNLFLWPSRSYVRKAIEIPMAYLIEAAWSKPRILEIYLNIAEWGPGIFGAEAAALYHFRKPPSLLTPREAALLAVSLPNPIEREAGSPGPGTVRLAENLLLRMRATQAAAGCVRTPAKGQAAVGR